MHEFEFVDLVNSYLIAKEQIMKCNKCETEMIKSKLSTGMAYVYVSNK